MGWIELVGLGRNGEAQNLTSTPVQMDFSSTMRQLMIPRDAFAVQRQRHTSSRRRHDPFQPPNHKRLSRINWFCISLSKVDDNCLCGFAL